MATPPVAHSRTRMTQLFPFLLPLRRWQRKRCFYLAMHLDGQTYARDILPYSLPFAWHSMAEPMVNEHSGYDIVYQHNKAHNLRIAAAALNRLAIHPGETFSYWLATRHADRATPYKNGLSLDNGKIRGEYGGGLCQLSTMLYRLFLHSPLTVVERHAHQVESFAPVSDHEVFGIDATINEGWLDLKVRNETEEDFQIEITFTETHMRGRILSSCKPRRRYRLFNSHTAYFRQNGLTFRTAPVLRATTDLDTGDTRTELLYTSTARIGYDLPDDVAVEERP